MGYVADLQEFLVIFVPIALIAAGVGFGSLLMLGVLSSLFDLFSDGDGG